MVESASVANEPEMNNKNFEESSRLLDGIVHWKLIFGELWRGISMVQIKALMSKSEEMQFLCTYGKWVPPSSLIEWIQNFKGFFVQESPGIMQPIAVIGSIDQAVD
jgi:hypothetical protein